MPLSAIFQRLVLVVEEAGVPGENHRPWTSNWYNLSLAAESQVHHFLQFTKLGANPRRIGQQRNLKRRLFKELNQPIDYTPKYTFKC